MLQSFYTYKCQDKNNSPFVDAQLAKKPIILDDSNDDWDRSRFNKIMHFKFGHNTEYHLLMLLTNVRKGSHLGKAAKITIDSLFEKLHVVPKNLQLKSQFDENKLEKLEESYSFEPHELLIFHIVCDLSGKRHISNLISENYDKHKTNEKFLPEILIKFYGSDEVSLKLHKLITPLTKHFGNHEYYKKPIFFISVGASEFLDSNISRIVQIDMDLKFKASIKGLFMEFENFSDLNIFGLAKEMQPIYYHLMSQHNKIKNTTFGSPKTPGFNSGIILINLKEMKTNEIWHNLLSERIIGNLVKKFGNMRGHLGDQDFYTLIGWKIPEIFYNLNCKFNRQLCSYWLPHYPKIWHKWNTCYDFPHVLHGNCKTNIDKLDQDFISERFDQNDSSNINDGLTDLIIEIRNKKEL